MARDIEAVRRARRVWYSRHAEHAKRKVVEYRKKMRDLVRGRKAVPCADCGRSYPHYVMDFDHVRGEKRFGIGDTWRSTVGVASLVSEMSKCEVVCANCHRERTHQRNVVKYRAVG